MAAFSSQDTNSWVKQEKLKTILNSEGGTNNSRSMTFLLSTTVPVSPGTSFNNLVVHCSEGINIIYL